MAADPAVSSVAGSPLWVRTRKWPDAPHWEFLGQRLGTDAAGTWVGVPSGTLICKPGKQFVAWCDHVVLVPATAGYLATLYGDDADRPVDCYVDITTPPVWNEEGSEVRLVDLDLDVIRATDGTVVIDDEDEFAQHQVQFGYPAAVIAAARRECDAVFGAVQARTKPFDGSHRAWIEALRARLQQP